VNSYRLLEHTADMGIEAEGETQAALFQQMALGLRQIITACPDIRPQTEMMIDVVGMDREELLVNWLNELVFLLETRHFLPAIFEIETIDEQRLRARVRGETFDPARHFLEREIKAVTYHQIKVESTGQYWSAQVFVDL
jgi:SHS2 domain-containing protein